MNTESLNEHLARKVMGWEKRADCWVKGGPPTVCLRRSSFNPCENIKQAFMVLEKCESWGMAKAESSLYNVIVKFGKNVELAEQNKSLPLAISLAAARATGWTE